MKNTITTTFSKPFGNHKFTHLDINIYHGKAGYNYFSGNRRDAGHVLSFSPCIVHDRGDGFTSKESILMSGDQWESGFRIPLDVAGRSNPFYMKRAMVVLNDGTTASDLLKLYEAHDGGGLNGVATFINETATKKVAKPSTKVLAGPSVPKLLTKGILDSFAKVGSQSESSDPVIVAKFFNSAGAGTWYATEYDPTEKMFFGYVSIFGDHNDEWGSFSLADLESIPTMERDRWFGSAPASTIIKSN